MLSRSSRKIAKFGLGAAGLTATYAGFRLATAEEGEFDPNNIGVARFGRAAFTVRKNDHFYLGS